MTKLDRQVTEHTLAVVRREQSGIGSRRLTGLHSGGAGRARFGAMGNLRDVAHAGLDITLCCLSHAMTISTATNAKTTFMNRG